MRAHAPSAAPHGAVRALLALLAAAIAARAQTVSPSPTPSRSPPSISPTPSNTPTLSLTPSKTPSPSPTPSPLTREACAACPAVSFLHTGSFQYINLTAPPFASVTHLEVFLWGAQGGSNYDVGGFGAFVSGVLPLAGLGPLLRVISGTSSQAPSVLTGMGGGVNGYDWEASGGGRSAIQAPSALVADGWLDIVTAGGGGGECSGGTFPASARGGVASPGGVRDCSVPTGCKTGAWLTGETCRTLAWGTGGGGCSGGGGWCGGLGAPFYGMSGGGTSFIDNLLCYWGADGNQRFTRTRRFAGAINSCGPWERGGGACHTGAVVVVPLSAAAASAHIASCGSWSQQSACTQSASASASNRPSASARVTPSASRRATASAAATASARAAASAASSASRLASLSSQLTLSASVSSSSTSTPSSSPSSTPPPSPPPTPTPSPTPSQTRRRASCDSHPLGCAAPALELAPPRWAGGGAAAAPPQLAALVASFGALVAPFSVAFPAAPAAGEELEVTCAASSSAFFVVAAPSSLAPCAAPRGAACARVGAATALLAPFALAAATPAAAAGSVSCATASTSSVGAAAPRYGAATLGAPALALVPTWPLLGAVLLESAAQPGVFAVVSGGGGGAARAFALGAANATGAGGGGGGGACAALAVATANGTRIAWDAAALPACAPALAAIVDVASAAADAAPARAAPAPSFAFPVSGATHVLVAASRGASLPAGLSASLSGAPCAVNWVAPGGAAASLTLPPFAALCAALGAPPNASDCGTAQLVLAGAPWAAAEAAVAAAAGGAAPATPLELPAAYPPTLAGRDWGAEFAAAAADADFLATGALRATTPLGSLGALAGGGAAALAVAAAAAPAAAGVRVLLACSDPSFAPSAACAAAVTASYSPPAGLLCAHGAGDSCRRCPPGAACPGGNVLLPLPGHWIATPASPPGELAPCLEPAAAARCPGHLNASVGVGGVFSCGVGYRGHGCESCAPMFYPAEGACAACPELGRNSALAAALPFAYFAAGLAVAAGVLTAALAYGKRLPARAAFGSVVALSVFFWTAGQSAAASFHLTQDLAPRAVAPLYSVLASLQLAGLSLPPACFGAPPYVAVYAAATAVGAIAAGGGCALAATARAAHTVPPRAAPQAALALLAAASALALLYGAIVSALAAVLPCTPPAPMAVRAYLALVHDGTALAAALADGGSPLVAALAGARASAADLARAAADPPFAAARGLRAALDARVAVSRVGAAAFTVCFEGAHRAAWIAAAGAAALLAALTGAGLWATLPAAAGSARRKRPAGSGGGGGSGGDAGGDAGGDTGSDARGATARQPARAALAAALRPADVVPAAAWLVPAQEAVTGISSALSAVAAVQMRVSPFAALVGAAAAVQLAFAALVLRAAPFGVDEHAWKNTATAALLILPVVSSAIALDLFVRAQGPEAGRGSVAVALVPLVCALPVPAAILGAWLRSVTRAAERARLARDGVSRGGGGDGDAAGFVDGLNPLASAAAATAAATVAPPGGIGAVTGSSGAGGKASGGGGANPSAAMATAWLRVDIEDGSAEYVAAATGERAGTLPHGAAVTGHFSRMVDPADGAVFFIDEATGESVWDLPVMSPR